MSPPNNGIFFRQVWKPIASTSFARGNFDVSKFVGGNSTKKKKKKKEKKKTEEKRRGE